MLSQKDRMHAWWRCPSSVLTCLPLNNITHMNEIQYFLLTPFQPKCCLPKTADLVTLQRLHTMPPWSEAYRCTIIVSHSWLKFLIKIFEFNSIDTLMRIVIWEVEMMTPCCAKLSFAYICHQDVVSPLDIMWLFVRDIRPNIRRQFQEYPPCRAFRNLY